MTLTLTTYYERTIWSEWTNRIKNLSKRNVRQHFFPNNMDSLDLIVNDFIQKRREAIAHCRNFKLLPMEDITQDERTILYNSTNNLFEFSKAIYDHIKNDTASQFIEEIIAMEYTRFHTLEVSMANRIQKAEEEEEEEAIVEILRSVEKAQQKDARKRKREGGNQSPPPLRRSSRRTAGIKAPISGAKVDTILPGQNY